MKHPSLIVLLLVMFALPLRAQEVQDSIRAVQPADETAGTVVDTVLIESYAKRFNPARASLFAAVLPGLGQVYNKKYWKLPLVYGGFAAIGYGLNFYQVLYKDYKNQLYYILENGTEESLEGFTEDQLRPAIDQARHERDFMIILMAGMYILQIIDAHVDAHLKEFDVNPNLQVKMQPLLRTEMLTGNQVGFSVTLRF
ncbi:MAG TPA: DUF5683 domain-containing protein [Cyclobacteriaceae bacterium]|nr:DUF5683 domain-containing protein [Cyclobacteriaceae bacterium]